MTRTARKPESTAGDAALRADQLLAERRQAISRRTDYLFASLFVLQWVAGLAAAIWIAPRAWSAAGGGGHAHVWNALVLGSLTSGVPLYLIWKRPGLPLTRQAVAVAQMLWSALLIHLTGGRIETHFHVFGSLALLACYRDTRVLLTATLVVLADHLVRGAFWPQSIYGAGGGGWPRALEHLGWVLFEVAFLMLAVRQSVRETAALVTGRAELEASKRRIGDDYRERTRNYRQYAEQLERVRHELSLQAQQLDQARAAAEKADAAKSQLVATVSHEIRTPLAAILGYADMLMAGPLDAESLQAAGTIKRNGEYLLNLVDDILDLSRIEAGKLKIEAICCSPRKIVSDVAQLMQVRADAKGLSLVIQCEESVPESIISDPTRLRQILLNLVGNAIKFSTRGEVRVRASLDRSSGDELRLRFEVSDQGIGLTPRQIENLFRPFAQADASTGRQYGGTGLGLWISKRLANLLGGDLEVKSAAGRGSTFFVTIAIRKPPAMDNTAAGAATARLADAPRKPAVRPPALDGRRILVADDSPDNRELVAFVLQKAGAQVTLVDNGAEAVRRALHPGDRAPFDVIVMDMQMPKVDGFTATEQLRAQGYAGPIIALTAHAQRDDLERCRLAGCDACATKPIDESLLRLIAQFAHERRAPVGC